MATRSLFGLSLDENIKTFKILFCFHQKEHKVRNWEALCKRENSDMRRGIKL